MTIRSYRDLRVWQAGMDLAENAYRLSQKLPASEIYGLTSQIRRSATSVPANIAEGYGRESTGSHIQFLKTARGSLRELETHILLAQRIGFVDATDSTEFIKKAESIGKMLSALIKSIGANKPPVS
jgi:four helix bundle protein